MIVFLFLVLFSLTDAFHHLRGGVTDKRNIADNDVTAAIRAIPNVTSKDLSTSSYNIKNTSMISNDTSTSDFSQRPSATNESSSAFDSSLHPTKHVVVGNATSSYSFHDKVDMKSSKDKEMQNGRKEESDAYKNSKDDSEKSEEDFGEEEDEELDYDDDGNYGNYLDTDDDDDGDTSVDMSDGYGIRDTLDDVIRKTVTGRRSILRRIFSRRRYFRRIFDR